MKITQEMRTKFWKYNLNPITGLPTPRRIGAERMGLDVFKVNKLFKNKYSN